MAVEAVSTVVMQKLIEMLTEESVTRDKVIVNHLKQIINELEETRGFLIDAEDKQKKDTDEKPWTDEYLLNLYKVEDVIETFALSIARQRKKLEFLTNHARFFSNFNACLKVRNKVKKKPGFLTYHALVFSNLNACRKLRKKVKKFGTTIKKLKGKRPNGVEDASLKYSVDFPSQRNQESISGSLAEEEEEEAKFDEPQIENVEYHFKNKSLQKSVSAISGASFTKNTPTRTRSFASRFDEPQTKIVESHVKNNSPQKCASAISRVSFTKETPIRTRSLASRFDERLRQGKLMFSYSYNEEELDIIGFRKDVNILVNQLTEGNDLGVVTIVGEIGSGKTTLARAIYSVRNVKHYFKFRAWVFVSKEYTKRELMLNLLKQVKNSEDLERSQAPDHDDHALETTLRERLKEKKYLIVLDDVCTIDVWTALKDAFPDTGNGSKILLTTREAKMADYYSADPKNYLHSLNKLSDDDSWDMFLSKTGFDVEGSPLHPDNEMKRKILNICTGLPLNIVLLGGLISTKKVSICNDLSRVVDQVSARTLDILPLSYNNLHVHLKLCLLYFVLFSKKIDIPVRRLLRLWLAEGFVPSSTGKIPEDVVQEYFEDLVHRNLILISKVRSDGSPRSCRLLGVVHDYLLDKADGINLFYVHRNLLDNTDAAGSLDGVRRLVEYNDIKNLSPKLKPSQLKLLRSYLSFNHQKKDTPAKEVGRFLNRIVASGFGLLRVLDLEGVYKPSLPDKLGELLHLRYLGLRWTFLDSLPPSVGDLLYLETLDLKHTYIYSLPTSIWKLKHLRHLNLPEIRLDMPMQPCSLLTELLTLWGLFVDNKTPVKNGLDRLCDLRELGITFNLSSSEDLVNWIATLTALQSLRLRSKDEMGRPSKLGWKSLSDLNKLSHLNLLGNLRTLPPNDQFPQNIKVLTLSVSELKEDPMPTLGQLSNLTVLRLLANSYLGRAMVCKKGGFTKLRVLKLWMLKELEDWIAEDGAMKSLKVLNIRCCDKLKKIPSTLLKQGSLEELILITVSAELTDYVQSGKSNRTSLTVKNWKFTSLPWEKSSNNNDEDRDSIFE